MINLNDAGSQRDGSIIPDGTIAPVQLTIRAGGAGQDNWLRRNKNGDKLMLDCEFTVTEGEHAKRKLWTYLTVEGHEQAADISMARLRAMLESARGIDPASDDESARKGRQVSSYGDFDGLRFWIVVGIEKGSNGYPDKNSLKAVVTPDRKEWKKLEQIAGAKSSTPTNTRPAANTSSKPSWAA